MKTETRGVLVLILVTAMLFAPFGTAVGAPTIDTETGNTATTSDIQSGTTLAGFNASETNQSTVATFGDNSSSPTVEISRNDSDNVVLSNDTLTNVTAGNFDGTASDDRDTQWNMTFNHSEIADLERAINANVSTDVTLINGSNQTDTRTVRFFIETDNSTTVQNLDDVDADPDTSNAPVEVTEDASSGLFDLQIDTLGISATDFSELDTDDRAIDGENTDVVIVLSNESVGDDAANAVASDAADGEPLYGMTLVAAGDETTMPIRVYNEEPPDEIDDAEDGDTYAVYEEAGVGGEDAITIHLGSAYEDDDDVAVTGVLNAGTWAQIEHRVATSSTWQRVFGFVTVGRSMGSGGAESGISSAFAVLVLGAPEARRRSVEEAIEIDEPVSPEAPETPGSDGGQSQAEA